MSAPSEKALEAARVSTAASVPNEQTHRTITVAANGGNGIAWIIRDGERDECVTRPTQRAGVYEAIFEAMYRALSGVTRRFPTPQTPVVIRTNLLAAIQATANEGNERAEPTALRTLIASLPFTVSFEHVSNKSGDQDLERARALACEASRGASGRVIR